MKLGNKTPTHIHAIYIIIKITLQGPEQKVHWWDLSRIKWPIGYLHKPGSSKH
jgi:hypothetical protein